MIGENKYLLLLLKIYYLLGTNNCKFTKADKRGEGYELKIPNVSNPSGGKAPDTLDEQIKANLKYLKMLQADMNRQVNTVNTEFIKQQPVQPKNVNKTKIFPVKFPEPELERLLPGSQEEVIHSAPFKLPAIVHHLLDHNVQGSVHGRKDLIGNMNIKGNMDHLKKLMKNMSNEIFEANKAMQERNNKKQKSEKTKGKNE